MTLLLPCPKCNISRLDIPPAPRISPISPLFLNNDPPESHEEGIARQIIASSITALQEIKAMLADVNQIVQVLKQRQEEYEEQIQLHQSIFARSRQIPTEVLSDIFLQTVADDKKRMSLRWCEESWTVGQVCRRWRATALSSPRLWSVLPDFDRDFRTNHRNHYRLQRSLERSGSLSLRLVISFFGLDLPGEYPFLNIILPHLHRLAHLTLEHPYNPFPLLPNVQAFPSLKSIAFTDIHRFDLEIQHIAQTAPLLQELEIYPARSSWIFTDLRRISVPWSQLRKVSVSAIDLSGGKCLLQAATSLEECSLCLVSSEYGSTAPTSFSSKYLGRLCIRSISRDVVEKFFERATFPSLKELSVDGGAVGMSCLSKFILRSSCILTFLKLPLPSSPVMKDFLRFVSLLPEVTDLGLVVGGAFRIDSLLEVDTAHLPLLPKLRHLYIRTDDLTNLVDEVDPSTFRNINSPAVLSETVAAVDTMTLQDYHLREDGRDKIFCLLDRRPNTNIDRDRVLLGNNQLRQMCTTHREGVPRNAEYAADLGSIVSEMEAHGKLHVHFLIDTDVIDNLRDVLEQLGGDADLKPLHQRLSMVLREWEASVHAYLNSVGWMKCGANALVYAKRLDSLVTKVVEDRHNDCFASFGVVDGVVIL